MISIAVCASTGVVVIAVGFITAALFAAVRPHD
jgi:hypothetical protein